METLQKSDISYFKLRLLELLHESYPEFLHDFDFIEGRSEASAEVYENAIKTGHNHIEASHLANKTLFANLPFSKMDLVFKVVCEEFYRDIANDALRSFAEQMLPVCQEVFDKYELHQDFEDDAMYDSLYTELTGTIQIWLEEN